MSVKSECEGLTPVEDAIHTAAFAVLIFSTAMAVLSASGLSLSDALRLLGLM
jgi:hypothetical protein